MFFLFLLLRISHMSSEITLVTTYRYSSCVFILYSTDDEEGKELKSHAIFMKDHEQREIQCKVLVIFAWHTA